MLTLRVHIKEGPTLNYNEGPEERIRELYHQIQLALEAPEEYWAPVELGDAHIGIDNIRSVELIESN